MGVFELAVSVGFLATFAAFAAGARWRLLFLLPALPALPVVSLFAALPWNGVLVDSFTVERPVHG